MPKLFENDRGEACLQELERLLAIFPKLKGSNETDELLLARSLKSRDTRQIPGVSHVSTRAVPIRFAGEAQFCEATKLRPSVFGSTPRFCGRLPPAAAVKKAVAVETRIAPRPPRRSRRALLTHRAPPLGSGVKAVQRLRMQDLDWRKEAAGKFDEFLPAEKRLLTAPPKRA